MDPNTLRTLERDIVAAVRGCRQPYLTALLAYAAAYDMYDHAVNVAQAVAREADQDTRAWWQIVTAGTRQPLG